MTPTPLQGAFQETLTAYRAYRKFVSVEDSGRYFEAKLSNDKAVRDRNNIDYLSAMGISLDEADKAVHETHLALRDKRREAYGLRRALMRLRRNLRARVARMTDKLSDTEYAAQESTFSVAYTLDNQWVPRLRW